MARASSRDEALEIAIRAAEASMKALSLVTDPAEKTKYSARVKKYMQDAERIKKGDDWRAVSNPRSFTSVDNGNGATINTSNKVRVPRGPPNSRKLPTREQVILLKAGFLNGVKFPPWTSAPDRSEFERAPGEDLFMYVSLRPVLRFSY
jgi:hypothetical protein